VVGYTSPYYVSAWGIHAPAVFCSNYSYVRHHPIDSWTNLSTFVAIHRFLTGPKKTEQTWEATAIASISFTLNVDETIWSEYTRPKDAEDSFEKMFVIGSAVCIVMFFILLVLLSLIAGGLEEALRGGAFSLAIGLGYSPMYFVIRLMNGAIRIEFPKWHLELVKKEIYNAPQENENDIPETAMPGRSEEQCYPPTYVRFEDALIVNSEIFYLEKLRSITLEEHPMKDDLEEGATEWRLQVTPIADHAPEFFPLPSSCSGQAPMVLPFLYSRAARS